MNKYGCSGGILKSVPAGQLFKCLWKLGNITGQEYTVEVMKKKKLKCLLKLENITGVEIYSRSYEKNKKIQGRETKSHNKKKKKLFML